MPFRLRTIHLTLLGVLGALLPALAASGQQVDAAATAAVRKTAEQFVATFNSGSAEKVAALFLTQGELIDEVGTVYQGQNEITDLLIGFYKRFPGTKLAVDIESIRLVGPVAIEEGTRTMTASDGSEQSRFRYLAVWAKADKDWRLASIRDFADDPLPTPHDQLESIAWLVGDWINEGADGKVSITYRWSDDKNFLLGEFQVNSAENVPRKSTQRIGWDPAAGRIRSWLFDSDGGFAEGAWTIVDDGAVIKSASVNPDGTTSNVTLNIIVKDKDHFSIEGTDRVIGDSLEDDFELTVTRRPPPAGK